MRASTHTPEDIIACPDFISLAYSEEAIYDRGGVMVSSYQRNEAVSIAHVDVDFDGQIICLQETVAVRNDEHSKETLSDSARQLVLKRVRKLLLEQEWK